VEIDLNPVWSGPFLKSPGMEFLVKPWLGDKTSALFCVSLVSCWQWIGIPVMMFAAALQGINEDYIEAVNIEGASAGQIFRRIKLPLIKPVAGIIAILTFVNNFNAFDIVFSMTNVNGAPNYSTRPNRHIVLQDRHRGPASCRYPGSGNGSGNRGNNFYGAVPGSNSDTSHNAGERLK